MICSPSGFCASLSWSMVSCGNRGSLPVAGAVNIVAANQPPAAAMASDDIQIEAWCMISSVHFLLHEDGSPAAIHAPAVSAQVSPSDRHDIGEALLRHRHPRGDVTRLLAIHVHRKHGLLGALLGPADQPAQ